MTKVNEAAAIGHCIDGSGVMTLEQVSNALGITADRVRQIERRALIKLLCLLRKRGLAIDDFAVNRESTHPLTRTCI